jgi:hypothetical protein
MFVSKAGVESGSVNSYGLKKQIEMCRIPVFERLQTHKGFGINLHLRRGIVEFHVKLGDLWPMVHTVEQRRLHRYRLRINISYTSRQFVKANWSYGHQSNTSS